MAVDQRLIAVMYMVTLLVVLDIAYWVVLKQDGSVLTATSGVIGGAIGYLTKSFVDSRKKVGK
jgi:lipoprotein signal peptidase